MKCDETSSNASLEASVVEANARFYHEIASKYDRYETCVCDPSVQEHLNRDLNRIASLIGERDKPVRSLDCGGGSGNLTLKMLKRGWSVTVVDISPDMLILLEEKARSQGFSPRLINDSIGGFLASTNECFDVVTFSSVLHHLYSYLPIVAQAVDHLTPNGVFYSNFDPVISQHRVLTSAFEVFDTSVAKLVHDSSDLLPGAWRRLRKSFMKPDAQHSRPIAGFGDLAEYHARTGIDDVKIIELLQKIGLPIREHTRRTYGRTAAAKFINRHLRLMESFEIMAQRLP